MEALHFVFLAYQLTFLRTRCMHLISQPPPIMFFQEGGGCSLLNLWNDFIYNTARSRHVFPFS